MGSHWTGNKYRNQKTNGFDSRKEADRYYELQLLERAGEIKDLRRQVKFILTPTQREPPVVGPRGGLTPGALIERESFYRADFTYYTKDGEYVVEDCKGMRTREYILKRKILLDKYGIRIKET